MFHASRRARGIAFVRRGAHEVAAAARRPSRFSVLERQPSAPWMVALSMFCGALGCTSTEGLAPADRDAAASLQDGAKPETTNSLPDSAVAEHPIQPPDGLGVPAEAATDTAASNISEVFGVDAAPADVAETKSDPGPYGPWTFATDDLGGWEAMEGNSHDNVCKVERVPDNGGCLKLTFTAPDCVFRHLVPETDLHDRQLKMRMHGEAGSSSLIDSRLFAISGAAWMDDGSRTLSNDWSSRTFLINTPGAGSSYDPTKITVYGVLFAGMKGTVYIDDIELVQAPPVPPLPRYEFNDPKIEDEFGFKSSGSLGDSIEVTKDGYAVVKSTVVKSGVLVFGVVSPLDYSRAKTMRVRLRVPSAPNVQIFIKTGADWTWHEAPSVKDTNLHEWSEIAWDLRSVTGLDFVREWGISATGVEGEVEMDLDWIRFEDTPLAEPDAGPDVTTEGGPQDGSADGAGDGTSDEASSAPDGTSPPSD